MTIDADVARISKYFGIDAALIQAVVRQEGDILKAVRCSIPECRDREQALEITCRSAIHAMSDYVKEHDAPSFIAQWAAKWAPRHVANDPRDLNKNWPIGVLKMWVGMTA